MAKSRPTEALTTWTSAEGPVSNSSPVKPRTAQFGYMVASEETASSLFSLLARVAASDATSLVEGETGTGKEATAESIHMASGRKNGPFIVVDCGAIPSQLLESELFGYERGAFTGAVAARQGAFEAANGGTIFLDEIGELSMDLQPKILRVLERRHIKRIGSNHYVPVDVRVLAATNRSLRAEVAAGRFRSDLYYRLAVVRVNLPPLRERMADLPILVEHILTNLGVSDTPRAGQIRSPEFLAMLAKYRWPGNVRQLRNYLERAVALGDLNTPPGTDSILPPSGNQPSSGPPPNVSVPPPPALPSMEPPVKIDVNQPFKVARDEWLRVFERRYLKELLAKHDNNISAAARGSGLDRIYLYRLLWKHGLKEQERGEDG